MLLDIMLELMTMAPSSPYFDCDWVNIIYRKMMGDVSNIRQDCCNMAGVTCEDGLVTMLRWNEQGLTGQIPSEIEYLTNLKVLQLQDNLLFGAIPKEIAKLPLHHLELNGNCLSGEIPKELGVLRSLLSFKIGGNRITGEFPEFIFNFKELKNLDLSKMGLTGYIPKEIGELTELELLDLSGNKFSGEIPQSIGNLTKLKSLILNGNKLTGEIPQQITNLAFLKVLHLHDNLFKYNIPKKIGHLSNLEELNLRNNSYYSTIPETFRNLKNLKILDLSNNDLNGSFPEWVHEFEMLKILNLGQNRFTGDVPRVIGGRLNSLRDHFRLHRISSPTNDFEKKLADLNVKMKEILTTYHYFEKDTKDLLWLNSETIQYTPTWDYRKISSYIDSYLKTEKERLAYDHPSSRLRRAYIQPLLSAFAPYHQSTRNHLSRIAWK